MEEKNLRQNRMIESRMYTIVKQPHKKKRTLNPI